MSNQGEQLVQNPQPQPTGSQHSTVDDVVSAIREFVSKAPETINKAEIPTGSPLVFEMENGKILKRYYLEDQKAA